jgi:hydrogenase/urease accessory protein HupE
MRQRRSTDATTRTEPQVRDTTRTRAFGPGLLATFLLLATEPTGAHDPGLSALDVRVGESGIVATLSLAEMDARALHPAHDLVAVWFDGQPLQGQIGVSSGSESVPSRVRASSDPVTTLEIKFPGGAGGRLAITSHVPAALARGHRQLVSVRTQDGTLLAEQMIDAAANTVVVAVGRDGSTIDTARRFFSLGLHHIVTGYDHLLFLTGLLLVVKGFRDAAAIVTAFTAAHAIVLGLAVVGAVKVPPQIVEPLIAASVIWVGVENLAGWNAAGRWAPAFGFGLVHGLAFAGALSELGIAADGESLALRLGFFNAGIEAGQLALSLVVVPLLSSARRWPAVALRAQTVGSVCVILAGAYWLVERVS